MVKTFTVVHKMLSYLLIYYKMSFGLKYNLIQNLLYKQLDLRGISKSFFIRGSLHFKEGKFWRLRPMPPTIESFFIRGRKILFKIQLRANLEGEICPPDLIHQGQIYFMPQGWAFPVFLRNLGVYIDF